MTIIFTPIGVIRTGFTAREGTPIQPAFAADVPGRVEVFPEYADGLKDLDGFSPVILVYHLHLSEGGEPAVRPFMEETVRGVFATRAPRRPNPIGISVVRLERVEGAVLHVRGVDIVDRRSSTSSRMSPPSTPRENAGSAGLKTP